MIDWPKLEDYENSKNRSFEELCYQIAKELYGNKGKFTSIDDSGGGDGVEFYLTLPNGDEWGWQAKFFYPEPRLNVGNRKKQIEKSLKKACEKHPNLKKWFLCTPTKFTVEDGRGRNRRGISEKTWFETRLIKLIPEEMDNLELIHWSKSDFNNWLSQPRFNGKKNYFFGELELSFDWFLDNYKKFVDPDKFEEELHTEMNIDTSINDILFENSFLLDIDKKITEIEGIYYRFNSSLNDLEDLDIDSNILYELINSANKIKESLNQMIIIIKEFKNSLNQKKFEEAIIIDFIEPYNCIKTRSDKYKNLLSDYKYLKNEYDDMVAELTDNLKEGSQDRINELNDNLKEYNENFNKIVNIPLNISSNFINTLYYFIKRLKDSQNSDLHILGGAGVGKTHIVSHISHNMLNNGSPALIISGRKFINDLPIEEQLKVILDIPASYSWKDFLDSLETAAKVYDTRIPLIIDGLNESIYNGRFSHIWKLGLTDLIHDIKSYKNLVLITTCRNTYVESIWSKNEPKNVKYLYGFGFDNIEEAVNKYFDYYKIKADLTADSLSQFEHPIYLKIFCETKNPERKEEKNIHIGDYTLFEIFEEYLNNINAILCERLDLHHNASFLIPRLKKIAEYLWNENIHAIPLDEMTKLIDGKSIDDLENWPTSKSKSILDEGLLVNRDWSGSNEVVYFTYDLLGGYLIAKYLIEQSEDIEEAIQSKKVINLFSESGTLHPLYEDIRRCLAALIPVKTGKYLHQLLDNSIALNTSIEALFEIPNEYINEDAIRIIKELFENPQNCETLLKLADPVFEHVNHHFNIIFWNELLKEVSIVDRDLSWTEYLRKNVNDLEKKLIYFEETCKNNEDFSNLMENRLYLLAINSMWFLTSTLKHFRDKATRALYWYGRKFPEKLFDLMVSSFEINDPYVSERILAATYGVCMARQYDFEDSRFTKDILPNYVIKLYDLMFKENAPHSTTHILKRDYARQIIEISLIHHPTILTENEKERIRPPYKDGGIRNWGESEDRDKGKYKGGNYPMEGIAHEDPVSLLGKGMDKYQKPPAYVKARSNLWWRVYQLGYSLELFGKIDEEIEHWNNIIHNSDEIGWAGLYGRKYVFIAVHELAGCRDDHGLLKPDGELNYQRTSLVNIDPSFPIDINKFKLVDDDFLGKEDISIIEWILKDYTPDMSEYLILDEINGEKGPWVLLDGYIGQTDNELNRDIYIFPRGFFVKSEDEKNVIQNLKQQNLFGRWLPEINEDHYVYAGEIPWCDTFSENEWDILPFEDGTELVKVPIKKRVVICDNKPLSEIEEEKLWNDLSDKVAVTPKEKYFDANRNVKWDIKVIENELEQLNDFDSKLDDSGNLVISRGNISKINDEFGSIISARGTNPKKVLKSELKKKGLEMKIIEVEVEKERQKYEKFKVLSPVIENHWELSNFPVIPDRNVPIPIRQIFESLQLCSQPQTFDLYDNNGNKASKYIHYGERYRNNQHFTYLRKDLFDLFLSKNNYKFIWAIWGGKEFSSEEVDEIFEFRKKHEDRKPFQEIIAYSDLKNQIEL